MLLTIYEGMSKVWEGSFIRIANESTTVQLCSFHSLLLSIRLQKRNFSKIDETKRSLLSSVDLRGVSWASALLLSPGVFQTCQARLGKPGGEVDILLPLSTLQRGAPEQDGPRPPRGAICSGLPGESRWCVSQLAETVLGLVLQGQVGLCWGPILMSSD